MQANLKAEALMKIAIAIAVVAGAVLLLSLIPGGKLDTAMVGLAAAVVSLAATVGVLEQMSDGPAAAAKIILIALGMVILAGAVALLAVAVAAFSAINPDALGRSMAAISISIGLLVGAMLALDDIKGQLIKAAASMVVMSLSLLLFAAAVKAFGSIDPEEMMVGGGAAAGALTLLVLALNMMPKSGEMAKAAGAMLLMSGSMLIMAAAFALFGMMEWDTLLKGMAGVAVSMGVMVASMVLIEKANAEKAALSIGGITDALYAMSSVIKIFGEMEFDVLKHGMITFALVMGIMVA